MHNKKGIPQCQIGPSSSKQQIPAIPCGRLNFLQKLQRAIAEWRGWGPEKSLGSPTQEGNAADGQSTERFSQESGSHKEQPASAATEQKRKYRRHPKPDPNAPEKPPSAYVLFSNTVREEVRSENLSFTEIARLVGERWQKLNPVQKETFESHASTLKETYNSELVEYKKTDVYKEYSQYLVDFRAKHAKLDDSKRPKLESNQSSASIPSPGKMDGVVHSGSHHRGLSMSSMGPSPFSGSGASMAPSYHHSVGGIPQLNSPMVHRSPPPYQSSQSRLDQVSSTSSMSEESSSTKADQSDNLSRTASLSLTNDSASAAPAIALGPHRTGWADFVPSSAYGNMPQRRTLQTYSPSTTSGTSPTSTTTSVPASGDWWRERGQDIGRPSMSGGTGGTLLPISQLVDSNHSEETGDQAARRVLPPLPNLSNKASQTSYSGLGTTLGSEQIHHPPELTPIRERPMQEATSQSENEAADVLAGLSEQRSGNMSTWSPRSRRDKK